MVNLAALHYCIIVEMVTGCVHWIVDVSNSKQRMQRTLDCKKKTSTSPNRRERPLIRKTGWGTTERERQMDRKREKGEGRMQCFMKKDDKCLIDVENVETTFEMCCDLS